jgi:hypothetical protein
MINLIFKLFFHKSQTIHAYYSLMQIDGPYYIIIAYFFIHLGR